MSLKVLFPFILTSDVSADLPNGPVARLRLMANASRRVGWSLINICNMLISNCLCEFFVEKKFELRSEVCDMTGHLPFFGRCPFFIFLLTG